MKVVTEARPAAYASLTPRAPTRISKGLPPGTIR